MVLQRIKELLKDVEREYNIRILFAIESGSRLWGMASDDSDYDVRFVYRRSQDRYMSPFQPKRDTIEKMYKEENIDLSGWDLAKYMKLAASSNPQAMEWLVADIIYIGEEVLEKFQEVHKCFIPMNSYMNYRSLAYNNYMRYIQDKDTISYKKYLYVLRGIANSLFIIDTGKIPPAKFKQVMQEYIPESIQKLALELIDRKRSLEVMKGPRIHELDTYIHDFFLDLDKHQDLLKKYDRTENVHEVLEQLFFNLIDYRN
ncbi:MAG: nucleotidyltransferase domain-containing protein [Candidatus Heimdallarchaeota archaeon]|nr:nucleotidyltransferase domain-containing protein [Candidatus Heimdallarchaeota archaeon]